MLTGEWFAVMVRPRFEKRASEYLKALGYEEYLPLVSEQRKWSDRLQSVEFPLFAGYLFCRFPFERRVPILNAPGVMRIVGFGNKPSPVPEGEIDTLKRVLDSGVPSGPCDYLSTGQKVKILRGPLAGMDGIYLESKTTMRVLVSVHLLQRSVYAQVERDWIATSTAA